MVDVWWCPPPFPFPGGGQVRTKYGNVIDANVEIRTHRDPARQLTATVLRVLPVEGAPSLLDLASW